MCTVAEKMSWAAQRQTSRLEDQAYCLMGIFDVNMPLLYGEGKKAFIRLQQEIMRMTNDQTMFTWGFCQTMEEEQYAGYFGMFASSPQKYAGCGNIKVLEPVHDKDYSKDYGKDYLAPIRRPYHVTNIGVQITLGFIRASAHPALKRAIYAILPCTADGQILCFPVHTPGFEERELEHIQDGTHVLRTAGYPVRSIPAHPEWLSRLVWRNVIVVERSSTIPPDYNTLVHFRGNLGVLETWPHSCYTKHSSVNIFHINSDCTSEYSFLRVRSRAPGPRKEFLLVVFPRPQREYRVPIVFDWVTFIGAQKEPRGTFQSLVTLFATSPEMLNPSTWPSPVSESIAGDLTSGMSLDYI